MNQHRRVILLGGFADDLATVKQRVDPTSARMTQITEDAKDADIPSVADIVIYVFSLDTGYSSQMHSIFTRIHDRVLAPREYLMAIDGSEPSKSAFPEISHLPEISVDGLKEALKHGEE